jgi:hypothetical protein
MTLDPKTATVAELVEQACGSLADAVAMLEECARRDPDGDTRVGMSAGGTVGGLRAIQQRLKGRQKLDAYDAAHPLKPEGV